MKNKPTVKEIKNVGRRIRNNYYVKHDTTPKKNIDPKLLK
jgi:hypothetical protein